MNRLRLAIAALTAALALFMMPLAAVASAASTPPSDQATKIIQTGLCAGSNLDINGNCQTPNNSTQQFNKLIKNLINILSAVVGVVAVIMIIVGGFRYITSGGNDTSVTGAKNTILYAIIGLIIVALSQIIVHFVLQKVTNA